MDFRHRWLPIWIPRWSCPLHKYVAERSCWLLRQPTTYDATETKDLDYFLTVSFMNRTRAQQENLKAERHACLRFAIFVDTYVKKDMLNGSAAEFDPKFDSSVRALKLHMLSLAN
jgi:hypothetical protein